jgi:hypothetical protein
MHKDNPEAQDDEKPTAATATTTTTDTHTHKQTPSAYYLSPRLLSIAYYCIVPIACYSLAIAHCVVLSAYWTQAFKPSIYATRGCIYVKHTHVATAMHITILCFFEKLLRLLAAFCEFCNRLCVGRDSIMRLQQGDLGTSKANNWICCKQLLGYISLGSGCWWSGWSYTDNIFNNATNCIIC